MLIQDIPESSDRVPVRYPASGVGPAERRKRTAVDDRIHSRHVYRIVQVLQYADPKHLFRGIRHVLALSFAAVRLYLLYPFALRHHPAHLRKEFLPVRSDFRQFVFPERHRHLLIHDPIFAYFRMLCCCLHTLCNVSFP